MLGKRFALCALVCFVVVAAWSETTGVWDSASEHGLGLRTPVECAPPRACNADISAAKSEYQQIVKADPSNKFGWYNLAVIAQNEKNSTTAAGDYERAIAIDPEFESALHNLGVMRLQVGNYTAAVSLLKRAVAANANDAVALYQLALALGHLPTAGAEEQASTALKEALKLDPQVARAFRSGSDEKSVKAAT